MKSNRIKYGIVFFLLFYGTSVFPRALPLPVPERSQPVLELVEEAAKTGRKSGGWIAAGAATCAVVSDGVNLKLQQTHSKIPCSVHTNHFLNKTCNGKSKDCPYKNYWYDQRIAPVVQRAERLIKGFATPHAVTTDDYLFGDLKDQYFPTHPFRVPEKNPDPTFFLNNNEESQSFNSEDDWDGKKEDFFDESSLEKLKDFRFEAADRRLLRDAEFSEQNILAAAKVVRAMDLALIIEYEARRDHLIHFSKAETQLLEDFEREIFYKIDLASYLLVDLANFKSFQHVFEDLYFLSKKFEFLIRSMIGKPGSFSRIANQIQLVWSSFRNSFNPELPNTHNLISDRLNELIKQLRSRFLLKNLKSVTLNVGQFGPYENPDVTTIEYVISSAIQDETIPRDISSLEIVVGAKDSFAHVRIRAISKEIDSCKFNFPEHEKKLETTSDAPQPVGWTNAVYEAKSLENDRSEIQISFDVAQRRFGTRMPYEK